MSLQVGYIDKDGHPKLKIKVEGTNPGVAAEIEAMIDTGFTGFLMLPIALALPLGLVLMGTGDYCLADGSLITNFLAKGKVTVGATVGEQVEGIIVLAGDDPLVGMESSLDKLLLVGKVVVLVDNAEFNLSPYTSH